MRQRRNKENTLKTASSSRTLYNERATWNAKPGLRTIYAECYQQMLSNCIKGNTVEIGSGSGNFKCFAPEVIATDIVEVPWIDIVTDAMRLPFEKSTVSNLIGFDVLHHIEYPKQFFLEAGRVLKPGGRLIFCEPAITPLSKIFYKYFHSEPLDLEANPFISGQHNPSREPFDANQAIPTLLFLYENERFHKIFSKLLIRSTQLISLFAYPLSGGFRWWGLLPCKLIPPLLRLERYLLPLVGKYMAFRMLVVVQRI